MVVLGLLLVIFEILSQFSFIFFDSFWWFSVFSLLVLVLVISLCPSVLVLSIFFGGFVSLCVSWGGGYA